MLQVPRRPFRPVTECLVTGDPARSREWQQPGPSHTAIPPSSRALGCGLPVRARGVRPGIRQLSRQPLASRSEAVEPGRRRQWSETRWERGFVGTGNPSHAWPLPPPRPAGAWGTKGAAVVMDPADASSASVPFPQPTRAAAYHLEVLTYLVLEQEHQGCVRVSPGYRDMYQVHPMTDRYGAIFKVLDFG